MRLLCLERVTVFDSQFLEEVFLLVDENIERVKFLSSLLNSSF